MKIDVEKSPPTLIEMENARRELLKLATITTGVVIGSVACLVLEHRIMAPLALLALICSNLCLMAIVAGKAMNMENCYKPISGKDCEIVSHWRFESGSASISRYIGKVNAQGRELVGAELVALRLSFERQMDAHKKALIYGSQLNHSPSTPPAKPAI